MPKKIKLLIVHPNLETGGAEKQVVQLCKHVDKSKFDVYLALYQRQGIFLNELDGIIHVKIFVLDSQRLRGFLVRLVRLGLLIKRNKPDVVYSYLENANVLTGSIGLIFRSLRIIWGIRVSQFSNDTRTRRDLVIQKVASILSFRPDLVIANNHQGLEDFLTSGYRIPNPVVIPNGIDCRKFTPSLDGSERIKIRRELNIAEDTIVIGQIARVVREKGFDTLIQGLRLLESDVLDKKFVLICVGRGNPELIKEYDELCEQLKVRAGVMWLGDRVDIRSILSACEIVTLASTEGDGFPNVVGESLSMQRPTVVTNIGDAAVIVRDTAVVIPPKNPDQLAQALSWILKNPETVAEMSKRGRTLIQETFSVERSVRNTENVILELCGR